MKLVLFLVLGLFGLQSTVFAQSLVIQEVDAISKTKILPSTTISGSNFTSIALTASRGEFESSSFVLRSADPLNVELVVTDLHKLGSTDVLPGSIVSLRIVKPWFQSYYAWNEKGKATPDDWRQQLVPELLVKDDTLIQHDPISTTGAFEYNRVKLSTNPPTYVSVNAPSLSPTAWVVPPTVQQFPFKDADTLQPFTLDAAASKQIWMTTKVPTSAVPGVYSGCIHVMSGGVKVGEIKLRVTVTAFDLLAPKLTYAMYYRAVLDNTQATVGAEKKTTAQMTAELINMRDHGVTSPTIYQPISNPSLLTEVLNIRQSVGLSQGPLYYLGAATTAFFLGSDTTQWDAKVRAILTTLNSTASPYGYSPIYLFGKDEARGAALTQQRAIWDTVHAMGNKVFVAGFDGAYDLVGDILDLFVHSRNTSFVEAEKWHLMCNKIFSYNNPQTPPENPLIWRFSYGLFLWAHDYDGAMPYAYQHCFGECYNDVDHAEFRDHMLTYPTVDGVLDTIAWEGFREAVDDVRYIATLESKIANATGPAKDAAVSFLAALKAEVRATTPAIAGKYNSNLAMDLRAVRASMIRHIEAL